MINKAFKERIKEALIQESQKYKEIFVDYEYLICSDAFKTKPYYILDAKKDNFQHLTGVHSQISAQSFFDKCVDGSLSEKDFDFIKKGQNEKSVKGTVRRKIKALPGMMDLFKSGLQTEENFKKNKIICSFATADDICTLGFIDSQKSRPKSLILGNELKNPQPVELVLRKKTGTLFFNEIVIGNRHSIEKYKDKINHIISEDLLNV